MDFEKTATVLLNVQKRIGNKILWPTIGYKPMNIYFPILLNEIINSNYECTKNEQIKSPSIYWKLISFTISTYRANPTKWDKQKVINACEALFEQAKSRKIDDFYSEGMTNHLKQLIDKGAAPIKHDKELISRLKASLWMFEEAAYYQFHDRGGFVHGPYSENDSLTLIYSYNTDVSKAWSGLKLEPHEIDITCRYPQNRLKVEFDCFNNYTGTGLQDFDYTSVIVDGKQEKHEEGLKTLLDEISKQTLILFSQTSEMTRLEIFKKETENAFEIIGKKPSKKAIEEMIEQEVIINKYNTNMLDYFNLLNDMEPIKAIKFKPNFK